MQNAWVLVMSGNQESVQTGAPLVLGLPGDHGEPAQLGSTASPPGVEGLPSGNVLLCVTLTIPLEKKRGPGQEGHKMPGMGLRWATWADTPGPGACKPGREILRGSLLLCLETGGGWEELGRDLKWGQTNSLEASFTGGSN